MLEMQNVLMSVALTGAVLTFAATCVNAVSNSIKLAFDTVTAETERIGYVVRIF